MMSGRETQQDRALSLLRERGMMRVSEFVAEGVTAASIGRLLDKGLVSRTGRGLYQLPDAPLDAHHSLAEAAKRIPRGVVCLVSALAFHELTDTMPSRVWMAIDPKDRKPAIADAPLRIVRFGPKVFSPGIETHVIEGVAVRIYSPAKTVADLFRYRQAGGHRYRHSPGLGIAIEGLREAIRSRKATPAAIAAYAQDGGVWKVIRPYPEALAADV